MKIGSIINNYWASEGNPTKYFIYTGIKGKYATGICLIDNKLEKIQFYSNDFKNSGKFEQIGFCSAFETMKEDLRKQMA